MREILVVKRPYEPPLVEIFALPAELSVEEWERRFLSPDKPYADPAG